MPWGVLGIKNVYDKEEVLNVHPVVVGGGTDGASVNIGQHSSIKEELFLGYFGLGAMLTTWN